ncbi:MAG: DUF1338 domain-containing protein [Phycisphaerales bacterium]|nr:DUF1338 domain-containing protein [Phycisphaerales bacterium]
MSHMMDLLWERYRRDVAYAQRYVELVESAGGRAVNDHVAFRSLNVELPMQPAGVEATRQLFLALGYVQRGAYEFPDANLTAVHLEHDEPDMPRVFISQLEVDRLPKDVASLVRDAICKTRAAWEYPADVIAKVRSCKLSEGEARSAGERLAAYFTRPWCPPPRAIIPAVNEVSQYAAWTLLHGNAVNHFTASINNQNVADWDDIAATVAGLRAAGVPMKDSIEGEPGSKLRQSSTKASQGEFEVTEDDGQIGLIPWTYAYYELAEREYITQEDGTLALFNGFLGAQTKGLFEMTRMG